MRYKHAGAYQGGEGMTLVTTARPESWKNIVTVHLQNLMDAERQVYSRRPVKLDKVHT